MIDSFPLTAADLRKHASLFRVYEQQLALELGGLSGLQINELTFARLTKPDPLHLFGSERGGEKVLMLGTDQRDLLVPKLAETLLALPPGGLVLDIGSGDGQTTGYALEGRSEPLCLVPLDPMAASLEQYQDLFATRYPQVSIPRVINSEIDELMEAQIADPGTLSEPFDAVISVHSLYFTTNPPGFLSFTLDRLQPGGRLLVVFSENFGRFTGAMTLGYFEHYGLDPERKQRRSQNELYQLIGLENQALSRSDCQAALQRAMGRDDLRVAEVLQQPTRVYGHDLGDMIAFAFINNLPMADDQNLARQIAYVSKRLQESPDAFDLRVHVSGPRARMFSVAQPQLFLAVEKL
jgi:SAM-dependent methyltransferase